MPSIGNLRIPILSQGMTAPGIRLGVSISSTGIDSGPNIPNQHGPQPNICNRRRSRGNIPFPLPQLYALAPKVIPINVGLLQPTSGIRQYLIGINHLFSRLQGSPEFSKQTPWPLELSSTNTTAPRNIFNQRQVFRNQYRRSSGAVWNIDSWSSSYMLVGSSGRLTPQNIILPVFYGILACSHFYVKINITVALTPFYDCTPINP